MSRRVAPTSESAQGRNTGLETRATTANSCSPHLLGYAYSTPLYRSSWSIKCNRQSAAIKSVMQRSADFHIGAGLKVVAAKRHRRHKKNRHASQPLIHSPPQQSVILTGPGMPYHCSANHLARSDPDHPTNRPHSPLQPPRATKTLAAPRCLAPVDRIVAVPKCDTRAGRGVEP